MTNQFLENERLALEDKIIKAREGNNENTYKNLIQAYEKVLELSRKENKWEDMYSHYYEGDKKLDGENEYVATWKQNYNGDIRDHKIYKVEKEINKSIEISFGNKDGIDGYLVKCTKCGYEKFKESVSFKTIDDIKCENCNK